MYIAKSKKILSFVMVTYISTELLAKFFYFKFNSAFLRSLRRTLTYQKMHRSYLYVIKFISLLDTHIYIYINLPH